MGSEDPEAPHQSDIDFAEVIGHDAQQHRHEENQASAQRRALGQQRAHDNVPGYSDESDAERARLKEAQELTLRDVGYYAREAAQAAINADKAMRRAGENYRTGASEHYRGDAGTLQDRALQEAGAEGERIDFEMTPTQQEAFIKGHSKADAHEREAQVTRQHAADNSRM